VVPPLSRVIVCDKGSAVTGTVITRRLIIAKASASSPSFFVIFDCHFIKSIPVKLYH